MLGILIILEGHGHTADLDRPLGVDQMAEDVAGLLLRLGIRQADFFGYSMGGQTAMRIAMVHPDLVGKLIVASAPFSREGYYPAIVASWPGMSPQAFAGTPIQAPTLILLGDADLIRPEHAMEMFWLLGGGKEDGGMSGVSDSQLAVLPGTTHFSIMTRIDLLLLIVLPF